MALAGLGCRSIGAALRNGCATTGFKADSGATLLLAGTDGDLELVLLGLGRGDDPWATGGLAKALAQGCYRFAEVVGLTPAMERAFSTWAALAWALGAYRVCPLSERSALPSIGSLFWKWPDGCRPRIMCRARSTAATLDAGSHQHAGRRHAA